MQIWGESGSILSANQQPDQLPVRRVRPVEESDRPGEQRRESGQLQRPWHAHAVGRHGPRHLELHPKRARRGGLADRRQEPRRRSSTTCSAGRPRAPKPKGPPPGPGARWPTTPRATSTSGVQVRVGSDLLRHLHLRRREPAADAHDFGGIALSVRLHLQHARPARHADLPDQHGECSVQGEVRLYERVPQLGAGVHRQRQRHDLVEPEPARRTDERRERDLRQRAVAAERVRSAHRRSADAPVRHRRSSRATCRT